jgi:hypothetical protein
MKSAPWLPNSSFARSQGSRDNGGGIRGGAVALDCARFWIRHAIAYSAFCARHRLCVFFRSVVLHVFEHVRCRATTRASGKNQRRQIEHGRLLEATPQASRPTRARLERKTIVSAISSTCSSSLGASGEDAFPEGELCAERHNGGCRRQCRQTSLVGASFL